MKKILILLTCVLSFGVYAQNNCYNDGSYYKHLGVGFSDPNNSSPSVVVKELVSSGNYLFVLGKFKNAYGDTINNIAVYEKTSRKWYRLAEEPNGEVKAAVVDNNKLYIAGTFTKIGNTLFDKLAVYDITNKQWASITTSKFPTLSPSNAEVKSMAVLNGEVYLSTNAKSSTNFITYKVTPTAIASFIHTNAEVLKLKKLADTLYLTGAFTTITFTSQPAVQNIKGIAKLHNGIISQLGTSGIPVTNGSNNPSITCIDVSDNTIYVGGSFTQYDGKNFYGILKYNGIAWDTATTRLASNTSTTAINSVVASKDGIFIGSGTTMDLYYYDSVLKQNVSAKRIARYNAGKWSMVTDPTSGSFTAPVVAIAKDTNNVFVLKTSEALLVESSNASIATRMFHGIKPSFSNAAENFRQVKALNDYIYFNYSDNFKGKIAKFNLQSGLIDTAFKIPTIASYTIIGPAAIGHKNNQSLLVVFYAKTTTGNTYTNFLFEYNEGNNTFTQIGAGIPSSSSNKDAWGCGYLRGKYFVLAEDLFEYNGTAWVKKAVGNNPLIYTSNTYKLYNAFDVSAIDSTLYFSNLPKLYKYNGTILTELYTSSTEIRAVHVANDGDVYFGGRFGGTFQSAGGINNIAFYSQVESKVKPLGGGVNVGSYGTYLRDITSIGDSIFVTGELGTNYNQPAVINSTTAEDVQVWNKKLQQWVCFDTRLSENQNLEAYKGGLIGTTNTSIAKNGTANIPAITSEGWWMWKLGTSTTIPAYIPENQVVSSTSYAQEPLATVFFNAYPNPASDFVVVELKNNTSDAQKIEITNLMGQIMLLQSMSSSSAKINTSSLSPGIYFLSIEGKEKSAVRIIIE